MTFADLLLDEHRDVQSCAGCGGALIPAETPDAVYGPDGWAHERCCEEES